MSTWPPPPEEPPQGPLPPIPPPPPIVPPPPLFGPAGGPEGGPGDPAAGAPQPPSAPPSWHPQPPTPPGWGSQPPPQAQVPWSVPAGYGAPYGAPPATSTNQLCLVSMITGIAGVASAFCCALFGIPLGIAAIATGIIGMTQVGSGDRGQGRGMAIAGICCGAAAVVVPILFAVLFTLPSYTGLQ